MTFLLKMFLALGLSAFLFQMFRRMKTILSSMAIQKPLPNIPQDVIVEILSRLPVRTLHRFKCVSKAWYTLVSDPGFIKLHLDINRNKKEDKVFVVSAKELQFSNSSFSDQGNALAEASVLYSADDGSVILQLKKCVQTFRISGSCDGLLLLIDKPSAPSSKKSIFILFNPSTREYNMLPEWPYSNEFEDQDEYSISGFGYNSRKDDYEVVRIGYDLSDSKYGDCLASLYSLKTNTWRRINASPPCRRKDPSFEDSVGILSNGTLHWLLKYRTPFKNFMMVATYVLADEKFSHVPLPTSVDGRRYCQLGILKGCLSVIVHQYEFFDVWVLKDYGFEDSWMKFKVNVPNITSIVTLMRLSRNDELLLRINDCNLALINPEKGRSRNVETFGVQIIRDAAGFCESLVSPDHMQNEAKVRDDNG